jgi:hypothetical protein
MQTSGAIPKGCGKLEINLTEDCSGPWYDISGESTSLAAPTQDRLNDVMYTLDGIGAIIEGGKLQPLDLAFVLVYTEINDEAWDLLADHWISDECSPKMCVRWSPGGGDVGDEEYLVVGALFIQFIYPEMDASSGGPIPAGFTVRARKIYRSIVSS